MKIVTRVAILGISRDWSFGDFCFKRVLVYIALAACLFAAGCSRDRKFSFKPHFLGKSAQAAESKPSDAIPKPIHNMPQATEADSAGFVNNAYVAPPQQVMAPMGVMTPLSNATTTPQPYQVQFAQSVQIRPESKSTSEPLPPTNETIRLPVK